MEQLTLNLIGYLQCRTKWGVGVDIVSKLSTILYEHNVHAQSFRMARDILREGNVSNLKHRVISDQITDGRIYNQITFFEVAAIIFGDTYTAEKRDIIEQKQRAGLQRIDEYNTIYLGYQYPLLFPYGEDGYRPNTRHWDKGYGMKVKENSQFKEMEPEDIPWE